MLLGPQTTKPAALRDDVVAISRLHPARHKTDNTFPSPGMQFMKLVPQMDIWSVAVHLIKAVSDAVPFISAEIRRHLPGSSDVWTFQTEVKYVQWSYNTARFTVDGLSFVLCTYHPGIMAWHYRSVQWLGGRAGRVENCACVLRCIRNTVRCHSDICPPQLYAWCFPAVRLSGMMQWKFSVLC